MNTYKIDYILHYPESDLGIYTAYVLANNFKEAEEIVIKREKKELESAEIVKIEKLEAKIFI